MSLDPKFLKIIERDFLEKEHALVTKELYRINESETWDSIYNLNNAIGAILYLAEGDLKDLRSLVDSAKSDFRDVIYWFALEKAKKPETGDV